MDVLCPELAESPRYVVMPAIWLRGRVWTIFRAVPTTRSNGP